LASQAEGRGFESRLSLSHENEICSRHVVILNVFVVLPQKVALYILQPQ